MDERFDPLTDHAIKKLFASTPLIALLAGAIVLSYGPTISVAQEPDFDTDLNEPESTVPEPENGAALAQKLCVGCHIVERGSNGPAQADVPSFPAIANRADQSFDALSNWLMKPHAPMPDPHLSRKEVRDLAGYILSLQATP